MAGRVHLPGLRSPPGVPIGSPQLWQCAACRHQTSVTAGTILHRTKTPLTVWFWAAYLMTTDKRGLSALLLQRQLGSEI